MTRTAARTALLLVVVILSTATPVVAGDPAPVLTLSAEERPDGDWMLRATLTRDGLPQSQQIVEFLQAVDFFAPRWVPLGSATTDTSGVASRLYSPTEDGVQQIVARHATSESAPIEIAVAGAVPAIPREPPALPIIRTWAAPIGAAVLIAVWLALAWILLSAVIGVRRSARRPTTGTSSSET